MKKWCTRIFDSYQLNKSRHRSNEGICVEVQGMRSKGRASFSLHSASHPHWTKWGCVRKTPQSNIRAEHFRNLSSTVGSRFNYSSIFQTNIRKLKQFELWRAFACSTYLVSFPSKKSLNFWILVHFSGKTNQKFLKFNHWGNKSKQCTATALLVLLPAGLARPPDGLKTSWLASYPRLVQGISSPTTTVIYQAGHVTECSQSTLLFHLLQDLSWI